jgi:hypothetical protein
MDPQLIAVAVLIALAALYVLRRTIRAWAGTKAGSCGGGCGCARTVERSMPERDVIEIQVRKD